MRFAKPIKDNPLFHVKIRKIQDEKKERDAFIADQLQVLVQNFLSKFEIALSKDQMILRRKNPI